jgi:hypothetical protein
VNVAVVNEMLLGAIAMAAFVAGLFFLRFAIRSRDRLFVFFAVSFWIECVGRILIGLSASWGEDRPGVYLLRLLSYGLILFAIWDKKRPPRR